MFGLSLSHVIIILVVVLIIFGVGKLPTVMGDLGKGVKAFKEGLDSKPARKPTRKNVGKKRKK